MKNKIVKDTLALTVITLVSGLLLGLVNDITAGPIASQQAKEKEDRNHSRRLRRRYSVCHGRSG